MHTTTGRMSAQSVVDRRGELLVLHHDEQLCLRRRVEEEGPDGHVRPVGNLLGRDARHSVCGEELTRGDENTPLLVLFRALAPPR